MAVANVPIIRLVAPMPMEQISRPRSIMARSPQWLGSLVRSPTSPRRAGHRGHFAGRAASQRSRTMQHCLNCISFRYVYLGGEYGSGVPISIGGYFFRLSKNSVTIFVTGTTTHELVQGVPSRSSLRSVRRLMTFGSGRVNGGSYMFCCQIKCTFQFRHLTADSRSAT